MRIGFEYEVVGETDQSRCRVYDLDTGDPIPVTNVKFEKSDQGPPLLTITVIPDKVWLRGEAAVTETKIDESANSCAQPVPSS